ncbi:hypothetical protein K469DRAFT_670795 [Zopfia rhizophila CBS 207.26]|uniref:Zn(2)-C6 fungal-type domain-containing protein n=1 Tax=Zopfia rhizophila CBS 207.26 TaxID=1314779 RepID=A0A6A6DQ29_9PEZI|nr:hypothetical protein K469DRAFT_670795 [Zopfia rhizophila CBS 207.26]
MDNSSASEIKTRKRKRRAVLSCNICRRRKLKCDRQLPCNRCVNGGILDSCAYDQDAIAVPLKDQPNISVAQHQQFPQFSSQFSKISNSEKSLISQNEARKQDEGHGNVSGREQKDRFHQLESRVAQLEATLFSISRPLSHEAQSTSALPSDSSDSRDKRENGSLMGLFKGHGYATFAYGPTSPVTIIVLFPELRPFMKEVYPNSTLARLQGDLTALEHSARSSKVTPRVLSITSLRSLLPDRATVDLLVRHYFDTFETTYRILHRQTFWIDYQSFWDEQRKPDSDMGAVILSILACAICTSTHKELKYNPNGSTARNKAVLWIKACESWLKQQSNKHRTLSTLQVRCLRLLALKTTCLKTKEIYQEAQAHFAFMKAVGMHRDPSLLRGRCSSFETEIRRRLWATTMELEIQASIDRGTTSSLSCLDYDCAPPRNINDANLNPDITSLPPSSPINTYTETSFLHISTQTAGLRSKLCSLTNNIHCTLEYQDVIRYDQEIQTALEKLPSWSEPASLQARTHLDLQLRQFLVILHTPRALQTQLQETSLHRHAKFACLESSVAVIKRHTNLLESGNPTLCCIRADYYRAALCVCHIAYHASNSPDDLIMQLAKSIFEDIMEKALRLQEERSMRPGRGTHQYWYISAASSLVRMRVDPARATILKQQATDEISKLYYKILALQEDPGEEYLANEVTICDSPTRSAARRNETVPLIAPFPSEKFPSEELRLDAFDFGAMSEWMLDDLWSFNDFPLLQFSN